MKHSGMVGLAMVGLVVLAVVLGTGWAQTPPAAPRATRVAVVDVEAVFDGYVKRDALNAQLEQKRAEAKAVDDARTKKIDTLKKQIEELKEGTREHELRLDQWNKLRIERAVWRKFQEDAFMAEHRRMMEQLYSEILEEVARTGKRTGYDLVLYKETISITSKTTAELYQKIAQRKVLYATEKIDITRQVLSALNR